MVKKVNNHQQVFSINAVEWWRHIGLVDEQKAHVRSSIIHADVIKIIQKLAYLENCGRGTRALVGHPEDYFYDWPEST